jgi:hypothetical protein
VRVFVISTIWKGSSQTNLLVRHVEVVIEAMGFAPWKVNAAVNMATVAVDGRIVANTAKEAVRGFARLIRGLA